MKTKLLLIIGIVIIGIVIIGIVIITISVLGDKPETTSLKELKINEIEQREKPENSEITGAVAQHICLILDLECNIHTSFQAAFDPIDGYTKFRYSNHGVEYSFRISDNEIEYKTRDNPTEWIAFGEYADIYLAWVSLPITSCSYPWHESNHPKTEQYYQEYISTVGSYDSSVWQEVNDATHYVIMRYYEDLGISVFDVKTSHDSSSEGMGEGCNTTVGGTWYLEISDYDLSHFMINGFDIQENS